MQQDLKELLKHNNVQKIEYVYPDHIQEELDRIDRAIANIDKLYLDIASSVTCQDAGQLAAIELAHRNACDPLISARVGLIQTAVPKIILHLEPKSASN